MQRDYSPFVFREDLLKKRAAKKSDRKKENRKQTNARVQEGAASASAPVNELHVNSRGEANERTVVKALNVRRAEQSTNEWPHDGLAIKFAMTTTSKPNKIKKQLFNRKQPPTSVSLKNNLANFRPGKSSKGSNNSNRSSARTMANGLKSGNSEETWNKQRHEERGKVKGKRKTERKFAGFSENNSPISENYFRRSFEQSKPLAERSARKFNLIKWTRAVVVTPGATLLERQAGDQPQTNQQAKQKSNRLARPFKAVKYRSTTSRPPLFVKRFGIDF